MAKRSSSHCPYFLITTRPVVDARSPLCVTLGGTSVLNRPASRIPCIPRNGRQYTRGEEIVDPGREFPPKSKSSERVSAARTGRPHGSVLDAEPSRFGGRFGRTTVSHTRMHRGDHAWISPSRHLARVTYSR